MITTNGIYNIVKSVGTELAGIKSMFIGIALGLFDIDQQYASALGEYFNIEKLFKIDSVASFIGFFMETRDRMHNGAVIELAGGLSNYEKVIEYFKLLALRS